MNADKVTEIFSALEQSIVNPKSELIYSTHFELLIAVVLSAQATDISVNKVTKKLFSIANTPKKILKLGEYELIDRIKTIGLFNVKAKNIISTCKILINQHNSQVPQTRKELEALPGVGRKTANVILNVAFGQPTIAVDTHIFRVCNRTKLAAGKTPLAVEQKLLHIVPDKFTRDAHHLLLLHGRYICTARSPKCEKCCINQLCVKNRILAAK